MRLNDRQHAPPWALHPRHIALCSRYGSAPSRSNPGLSSPAARTTPTDGLRSVVEWSGATSAFATGGVHDKESAWGHRYGGPSQNVGESGQDDTTHELYDCLIERMEARVAFRLLVATSRRRDEQHRIRIQVPVEGEERFSFAIPLEHCRGVREASVFA